MSSIEKTVANAMHLMYGWGGGYFEMFSAGKVFEMSSNVNSW